MKKLRLFFALLLLANFLACAIHCQLEAVGKLSSKSNSRSISYFSQDDSKESDVCDWAQSGGFYNPDHRILNVLDFADLVLFEQSPQHSNFLPTANSSIASKAAPQELLKSWHFALRTALPARAPSWSFS